MPIQMQGKIGSKNNTTFVSKQIERTLANGSRTGDMARTVLNSLKDLTDIKNLSTLSEDDIKVYVRNLQDRVAEGKLTTKTTATYISALNNVINYTNTYVGKNHIDLKEIKAKDYGLSAGPRGDVLPSATAEIHSQIKSYFIDKNEQKNDIKMETMPSIIDVARDFGLRITEAILCPYLTPKQIDKVIETGQLPIFRGTKNGKPRNVKLSDVKTTRASQINTLKSACKYMSKHKLSNLCPTKSLSTMRNFVYKAKGGFEKASGLKYNFHDERRTYAQQGFAEYKAKLTVDQATMNVSSNLGHHRKDVINDYIPK